MNDLKSVRVKVRMCVILNQHNQGESASGRVHAEGGTQ